MLYELIAIVRPGNINYVKDIARQTMRIILDPASSLSPQSSRSPSSPSQSTSQITPGVIRSLSNWGVFSLPRPTVKYQTQHHKGHYFVMQFDSSAAVQREIQRQLGLNPHMIRYSVIKIGDQLGGPRNRVGKMEDLGGAGKGFEGWGEARGVV